MKKKASSKLTVNRETILQLDWRFLRHAAGGEPTDGGLTTTGLPTTSDTCSTAPGCTTYTRKI